MNLPDWHPAAWGNLETPQEKIIKYIAELYSSENYQEFEKKSGGGSGKGGWVTLRDGRHIFIGNESQGHDRGIHGSRGTSGGGGTSRIATSGNGKSFSGMSKSDLEKTISEHAQNNPNVKNPEALSKDLAGRYAKAQAEKATIDKISQKVASKIPGATVLTTDIKGVKSDGTFDPTRSIDKLATTGDVKDLARNTILVNSVDQANMARDLLAKEGVTVENSKDYFANPTYLGYRGMGANHTGVNGTGEIQINVPEIIYYKEPMSVSRAILGQNTFNSINSLAQSNNLTAGQGHEIYSQVRQYENQAIAAGRVTAQGEFVWTRQEYTHIYSLVQQSNRGYDTALSLADARASR